MLAGSSSDFVVTPGAAVFIWASVLLCVIAAGLVTALKGRWGWLLVGFLFGGTLWLFTAFLPAAPGSAWANRRPGPAR